MSIPNFMPINYLVPFVAHRFDASQAIRGLRGMPRKLLLIGQRLPTAVAVPYAGLANDTLGQITTEVEAIAKLGEGSMLLAMWRGARANAVSGLPIHVVCLADNATANKAAGKFVLSFATTGGVTPTTAPLSGEATVYLHSQRIAVGVTVGDTLAQIAAKFIVAINALPSLQVTASAGATPEEVALECKWAGATGNEIDVRVSYFADDTLAKDLIITVTALTGGTLNPSVTPVITAMNNFRATEIVCPYTDNANLAILEADAEARWLANNMADGQIVKVKRGTEGQIVAWKTARNSAQGHTVGVTRDLTNTWELAAMLGAAIESGAALDPAVPFTGTELVGYVPARQQDDWTTAQLNVLLTAGVSVLRNIGGKAQILRMVTDYTTHATGALDPSYRNLCWVKTLSYYRWFVVTEFQTKYNNYKLAEYITEPIPGQKIMTKMLVEEIMLGVYEQFCAVAMMQNPKYYKQSLLAEIDGTNGRVKIIDEPVLVTQHYQTEITSQWHAGHV